MFCGNCGVQNPDGSKFCTACGKALSTEPPAFQQGEPLIDLFLPQLRDDKQCYEATKLVVELHSVPWKDAMRFVKQAPYLIRARTTSSGAEPLKKEFASKGITLAVQPHGSKNRMLEAIPVEYGWLFIAIAFGVVGGVLWMYPLSVIAKWVFTLASVASGAVVIYLKEKAKSGAPSMTSIALRFSALVAIAIVGIVWISSPSKPDRISALSMAQVFVREQLAPSPARFPLPSEHDVEDLGGGLFRVSSYVDSENVFGGKVRRRYTVRVRYLEGVWDQWQLEDIKIY